MAGPVHGPRQVGDTPQGRRLGPGLIWLGKAMKIIDIKNSQVNLAGVTPGYQDEQQEKAEKRDV